MSEKLKKTAGNKKTEAAGKKPHYTLHLISDATGSLAGHMINAVLTQFPGLEFTAKYHIFQYRKDEIEKTISALKPHKHLVFYALVHTENKIPVIEACQKLKIPHFDLTGSLVQFIADHTGVSPVNELSRLHETNAGYFQRIEAMEFTAQHDDSRRLESIDQADLVLVGLSRVSKSPTSMYLGALGYKVANVSIVVYGEARSDLFRGFPKELDLVKNKIAALTVQPKALHAIRQKRFDRFKEKIDELELEQLSYYNLQEVIKEVMFAERAYKKRGYPVLDITGLTVEEIAAKALKLKKVKQRNWSYA